MTTDVSELLVKTIKGLSMDAIEAAKSGHPGMPMGMADAASVLWTSHLKHNPANPEWLNRDRFVLSAGHGSMLLYSLMHLAGYEEVPMEEIRQFRQLHSKTPGHPETQITRGVETTTGPLGQGLANAVGMALAEAHLAAKYNRLDHRIVDHMTYAIVGDGCLMEGISYEAASLAGHLRLGKLVVMYDDNEISIDGRTDITFTEDVTKRFEAMNWQVLHTDGHDRKAVHAALESARSHDSQPTLIRCKTLIGKGAPTKEDSSAAHGAPLGESEIAGAKSAMEWPEAVFHVPEEVTQWMSDLQSCWAGSEKLWNDSFEAYKAAYPAEAAALLAATSSDLSSLDWGNILPEFEVGKAMATRKSSGVVLNAIASHIPQLVGGSADLEGSNNTKIAADSHMTPDDLSQRNIHFGVREHAMGALANGMALHGGVIPFCGTFLQFSDYMRPAVRLAALMEQRVIYVWTHDSIFLGEDGPTHQPVEHMAALRSIPNLHVLRPGDAKEVAACWKIALTRQDGPSALALTRQNVETFANTSAIGVEKGAYTIRETVGAPDVILLATGSELGITLEAAEQLANESIQARVVSVPCWELFTEQSNEYAETVLPSTCMARVVVEAGRRMGWERFAGPWAEYVTIERFGESANAADLSVAFGFTADHVIQSARKAMVTWKKVKDGLNG